MAKKKQKNRAEIIAEIFSSTIAMLLSWPLRGVGWAVSIYVMIAVLRFFGILV